MDISRPCVVLQSGDFDPDADVHTFHGVVIENDEVTHGANGAKFWPADELQQAAGSLTGKPVVNGHTYDESGQPPNGAVVGKIANDGYDPDIGWIYEMEIGDSELARKLHNGHLEVSLHGGGRRGGVHESGAEIMADIVAADLAVVPYGGARGNSVNPGPSDTVAAMSAAELAGRLDAQPMTNDDTQTQTTMTTQEGRAETDPSDDVESDLDGDPEMAEVEQDKLDSLLKYKERYEEIREEKDDLKAELEETREEIEPVRDVYMKALLEHTSFSEDFYADRSVTQLQDALADVLGLSGQSRADSTTEAAAQAALQAQMTPQTSDVGSAQLSGVRDPDEDAELRAELEDARDKLDRAKGSSLGDGFVSHYETKVDELEAELEVN